MDVREGGALCDRYRLIEVLGRGGMADVWAATDEEAGLDVAIKVLRRPPGRTEADHERFQREAGLLRQLDSPWICRLLDAGRTETGRPFLVFERLRGETLDEWLKREGSVPLARLHPLVDQVLAGLADAHAVGVIHRDLKPSNIFIERDSILGRERARLIDFGIAKAKGDDGSLTSDGAVLGSFDTMAPEQISSAADAGERSDLYSAGVTVFRALAGRLPFETTTAAAAVALKLSHEAPTLTEITGREWPGLVESYLKRLLERDPALRFASAEEARAAWQGLSRFVPSEPKAPMRVVGTPITKLTEKEPDTITVDDPLLSPRRRRGQS